MSRWSTAAQPALGLGSENTRDAGRDDFYDHLLNVCVLLLLQEQPDTPAELPERLRPLGFDTTAKVVEAALGDLASAQLVRSPETAQDDTVAHYAVTPEGLAWLRAATNDLRRTEVVLGGFLARCGERLISLT